MKKHILLKLAICLAIAGPAAALSTQQGSAVGTAANWPNHGGGADESVYSQLEKINSANVGKLGLASSLDLDGEATMEATPLAVNGVLYFSGSYSAVYAVNAATGKLLWKYDPQIWKNRPLKQAFNMGVNRGVAYADGRVFICAVDGRLIALDAKSGKELWVAETLPPTSYHTSTGAPRTFNGKVIIGNAGADIGMRGYVTAYDQVTGKQVWRFYTVPGSPEENKGDPAMEMAAATWSGEYWKKGTGGTVWSGITFDPELNRIYIGVGNAGPYDPKVRSPGGGDNLFIASIVALDADTGKYVWHYQENPKEGWDYKAVANMITATMNIDGKPRKVLMQSPTNGFFYVLDRETGKLISAEKTGKVTWAERIDLTTGRPVEAPNIRYETGETIMWPSPIGTHNWQDMSYSPKTGLVYIPYSQLGVRYSTKIKPGTWSAFSGVTVAGYKDKTDPDDGTGALLAWDPVAQKPRWKMKYSTVWNGGTLATAGNLVFQGTADGYFLAYDAASGKELWRFNAGHGILANPISYSVKGKQYVSVLTGYGGLASSFSEFCDVGWKYGAQKRRLLTFALGGKKVLPPSPGRDMVVHAVDDPALEINEADFLAGQSLGMMCGACHGLNLHGVGSPGPDLRESQLSLSEDGLWAVLHDGSMAEQGMPRYSMFTRAQVHKIYIYIRAKAREALGLRKPSEEAGASSL